MNVKVVNLRYCVRSGCKDIVNALIDKGADVNAKGKNEKTPLHWAAENGYLGIVKALIKAGANVNIRGKGEETPLHWAAYTGHLEVVEALIDKGAEVDIADKGQRTPLHFAAVFNCTDTINVLINRGANINARDQDGNPSLHLAAKFGCTKAVNALIDRGADINAKDEEGRTPLRLATIIAHEDVIEALIRRTLIQDFSIQRPYYLTDTFSTCWNRCLDETKELEEENEPLYDFLRESNINNLVSIWERNENVCSRFDNQESLQEQYPEYAHILINKANEVEKEIFLHNHKPLIDVLSQLGYHEGKTPDRIRAFLEENRDRFKVEFGNPNRSLIDFVSFEDIKARHVPELGLRAVVSRVIGKNTPSRNLLNSNSEQHQAVGLLYS